MHVGTEHTDIKTKAASVVIGNSRGNSWIAVLMTTTSNADSESELFAIWLSIADRQHTNVELPCIFHVCVNHIMYAKFI